MTTGSKYGPTPSQTVGPYFTMRITGEGENVLTSPETVGERIRIEGFVLDGDGNHIEDALARALAGERLGPLPPPSG